MPPWPLDPKTSDWVLKYPELLEEQDGWEEVVLLLQLELPLPKPLLPVELESRGKSA